jgi:membrane-associated phospholipid phosphatase
VRALGVAVAVAALAAAGAARAETYELRHDVAIDLPVTLSAGAVFLAGEYWKSSLAPKACWWCSRNKQGLDTLLFVDRDVRDALVWKHPAVADAASNYVGFLGSPVTIFGTMFAAGAVEKRSVNAGVDALLVSEALMASMVFNSVVKIFVARERPFVHVMTDGDRVKLVSVERDLSFYSGHTAFVFTLAAAAGTVSTMRGYRLAPLVWGSGAALGLTTGYLRIAADRHYFSDVMTGAVFGTAFGLIIPFAFHPRTGVSTDPTTSAAQQPFIFRYGDTF